MIELSGVSFKWPDAETGLDDISINVAAGDKLVLLGANGCGKSSLLKLMNGLIFADHGQVRWKGENLSAALLKQRAFARVFRRQCVLLFQQPESMLFNPTVREEIAYGLRQLKQDGSCQKDDEFIACVEYWAGELGLSALLDKAPFLLSGGQKQKLALACVLALEPELLLLDEPTASLDPATVAWLIDTLLETHRTVVVSTHNLSMAAELGNRCVVLSASGKLLFDGPVSMALSGNKLLEAAGLAHRHRHKHGEQAHSHLHAHNWHD